MGHRSVSHSTVIEHQYKAFTDLSSWQSLTRRILHQILNLFDRDLEEVEKEYVFRSMKVGGDGFHYSKMARWASDTRRKLEQEVNVGGRVYVCVGGGGVRSTNTSSREATS